MSNTQTTPQPTDEQAAAIDMALQGESLKIIAYAGSGKTTTLELISHAMPQKKGVYLAFNKAIASNAAARFGRSVECRTFHSMAFRQVSNHITRKLNLPRLSPAKFASEFRIAPQQVRRKLDNRYERFLLTPSRQASLITNALNTFCSTNAQHPAPRHIELPQWLHAGDADSLRHLLFPLLEKRWQDAINPQHEAGISHDIYLKLWALSKPVIATDYILFDEAQDADPIMLGILLKQPNAQVVYVGDPHQQIYAWRGAVNAMHQLPITATRLTQSFRFGDDVADVANVFLAALKETKPLTGNPKQDSRLDTALLAKRRDAILCRTNARAIELMLAGLKQGDKVALQADRDRLLRFIAAASQLKAGKPCADVPELSWFSHWQDVLEYCETQDGGDMKSLVRLVDDHGAIRLTEALHKITPVETADYVISTAHKAKGLEWQNVQIENDYNFNLQANNVHIADDELRLLYVAATRAKDTLNVHHISTLLKRLIAKQHTITPKPLSAQFDNMMALTPHVDNVPAEHTAKRTTGKSRAMQAARQNQS